MNEINQDEEKVFLIPVVWQMCGIMRVSAKTLTQAENKALEEEPLPEGDYIEDSCELDTEHYQYGQIEREIVKRTIKKPMNQTIQEIELVAYILDHQDGGGSTTVYGSLDDLKQGRFGDLPKELQDERVQEILNEDDPYENGEINFIKLRVTQDENGKIKLLPTSDTYKYLFKANWGQ